LANYCRERGLRSLADLDLQESTELRRAVGRKAPLIAQAILERLRPLYLTPEETREHGYILTEHFGRKLIGRSPRIDLTTVSQRWLRDLLWDHFAGVLRSQHCPRSGHPFDGMRRAGIELGAFLEIHAPEGGHDPTMLTGRHMQQFAADQLHRERERLPSIAARGVHGSPSSPRTSVMRSWATLGGCCVRHWNPARPSGSA
jgi:hypothetical protein